MEKTFCIIGAGGFGREVLGVYEDLCKATGRTPNSTVFAEEDAHHQPREVEGVKVVALSSLAPSDFRFIIAIGNPQSRQRIAEAHSDLEFETLVHPTAVIGRGVNIGTGSILCAGSILTCDISIGRHAHINLATTIGHDAQCGDYFTAAPGARIGGGARIGDAVYLGTGALLRDHVLIGNNVVVGMGAAVVRDLTDAGTYVGVPARRMA